MIGNGGPLCALAGTLNTKRVNHTKTSPANPFRLIVSAIRMVRKTLRPYGPYFAQSAVKGFGVPAQETRAFNRGERKEPPPSSRRKIYPLIKTARISMGWNISHMEAVHSNTQTVAHGTKTGIGFSRESSSARP